jgi:hypothetical protein
VGNVDCDLAAAIAASKATDEVERAFRTASAVCLHDVDQENVRLAEAQSLASLEAFDRAVETRRKSLSDRLKGSEFDLMPLRYDVNDGDCLFASVAAAVAFDNCVDAHRRRPFRACPATSDSRCPCITALEASLGIPARKAVGAEQARALACDTLDKLTRHGTAGATEAIWDGVDPAYIQRMRKPRCFGDSHELQALATAYRRKLLIFQIGRATIECLPLEQDLSSDELPHLALGFFPGGRDGLQSGHYVPLMRVKHQWLLSEHRVDGSGNVQSNPPHQVSQRARCTSTCLTYHMHYHRRLRS